MTATFRVSRNTLSSLLSKGLSVVPSSAAVPLLQCFKIDVTPECLSISSTNLENSIKSNSSEVQTVDFCSFVVPAKKLNSIVSKADVGDIDFSVSEQLTVTSGNASWDLSLPSGEAFPAFPDVLDMQKLDITTFKNAFLTVKKFASTDVTRPSLRMIHVEKSKMTACDGIRFSQVFLGDDFSDSVCMDIPVASSEYFTSLLKNSDDLSFSVSDANLVFKFEETYLFMNKMTAAYPSVEQIMLRPALENKTVLKFDRSEMIRAVNRVRINADLTTEAVGLAISATSITVTSKDKNGNGASDTIPASWPSKDRLLTVNFTYLLQLLQSSNKIECEILLGDDTKSRKSLILLKEDNYLGLFPQTSGNLRVF